MYIYRERDRYMIIYDGAMMCVTSTSKLVTVSYEKIAG